MSVQNQPPSEIVEAFDSLDSKISKAWDFGSIEAICLTWLERSNPKLDIERHLANVVVEVVEVVRHFLSTEVSYSTLSEQLFNDLCIKKIIHTFISAENLRRRVAPQLQSEFHMKLWSGHIYPRMNEYKKTILSEIRTLHYDWMPKRHSPISVTPLSPLVWKGKIEVLASLMQHLVRKGWLEGPIHASSRGNKVRVGHPIGRRLAPLIAPHFGVDSGNLEQAMKSENDPGTFKDDDEQDDRWGIPWNR